MSRASQTTTIGDNELARLQNAITDMDALSQSAFSEIAAIARLAVKALEADANNSLINVDIIHAFNAIQCKADDVQNCINYQAEEVGCNWVAR